MPFTREEEIELLANYIKEYLDARAETSDGMVELEELAGYLFENGYRKTEIKF